MERVVVVGGGVLGTMHALEACRRGFEVVQLEQDQAPRKASVRNFGLVWVSGRAAGDELAVALRARELWERLAVDVPDIGFRPDGSLTLAESDAEVALLEQLAAGDDAKRRQVEVLSAPEVTALNPAVRGRFAAGLVCRSDAVVEPGEVLGALRRHLAATGRYRYLPGRRCVAVASGAADDQTGARHEGSLVVLCTGAAHDGLGGVVGSALAAAPLRRCRLQMLQTAPCPERLTTALADADSMRYYPAFDLPARRSLPPPSPVTARFGLQLLAVQRASGALTIGDTHAYDEPFDFAVDEAAYVELVERAERLLGWSLPAIERRWAGVYSAATDDRTCLRLEPVPGLVVVTGPAGRGMTLSPALAAETFEQR